MGFTAVYPAMRKADKRSNSGAGRSNSGGGRRRRRRRRRSGRGSRS